MGIIFPICTGGTKHGNRQEQGGKRGKETGRKGREGGGKAERWEGAARDCRGRRRGTCRHDYPEIGTGEGVNEGCLNLFLV